MSKISLSLLCTELLHERLIETLLHHHTLQLFVSSAASAHGLEHAKLNARESVLGMASMTLVNCLLISSELAEVLAYLRQKLAGTGIHYWVTPVAEQGEFE